MKSSIPEKQHPLYELCYRAYYWMSFSPEKRAVSEIQYYESQLAEFKELCGEDHTRFEDIKAKFTQKFIAHMTAKGRCMSSMITGPANFPVARNEKANAAERKRGDEVTAFVERVRHKIDLERNPHKYGISSDAPDALEALRKKLTGLEKSHQMMKDVNKIVRKKSLSATEAKAKIMEVVGLTESQADEILLPDCFGGIGFASYSLSNNLANIKTTLRRIAELEAKQDRESTETIIAGVRVVENVEDNRIQLFFDGKPEDEMRQLLKSRGFRWSPKNGCWQRMLNANGKYAARMVLQIIQENMNT